MATIVAFWCLPNFNSNSRPLNNGLDKNALHIWIQNDLSFSKLFKIHRSDVKWQLNDPENYLQCRKQKNHSSEIRGLCLMKLKLFLESVCVTTFYTTIREAVLWPDCQIHFISFYFPFCSFIGPILVQNASDQCQMNIRWASDAFW